MADKGGVRADAAPAPRSEAGRDRPHSPAPAPMAMADRGRYPRESGVRVSRPGPPGPPSPPSPRSRGGRGGGHESGEGQALPRTPRVAAARRLPSRFPTDTSPCQLARGEGEHVMRGRAEPRYAPPGCRGAAASRWQLPLVRLRWEKGRQRARGGSSSSEGPGLPRRGRVPAETAPCQAAAGTGERPRRGNLAPPRGLLACHGTAGAREEPPLFRFAPGGAAPAGRSAGA